MVNNNLVGGVNLTLLKNHGVSNSWDDDIPNIWKNVSNHQPVWLILWLILWLVDSSLMGGKTWRKSCVLAFFPQKYVEASY